MICSLECTDEQKESIRIRLREAMKKRYRYHYTILGLPFLLMNRPFYWHYIERTGGVPQPMQLTLITRPNEQTNKLKGERLHFGAPRLHQLFRSAQKRGSFIRLYEEPESPLNGNAALHPWLGMNVVISYECDRKKDDLVSLGLHLIFSLMGSKV